MLKPLALATIRCYQRFISPRKGFRCAYRAYTGCASCSALGYRVIRRYGVWRGWLLLRQRLHKCSVAYRRYRPLVPPVTHGSPLPVGRLARQAGFFDCACDLPCDAACELPCELPCNSGMADAACDVFSCGTDIADCFGGEKSRKRQHRQTDEDSDTHLPPRR